MTADPAHRDTAAPSTVGEVLDRLAFVVEALRAVRRAADRGEVKMAIDRVIEEVNAIRVGLPTITPARSGAKPRPPSERTRSNKAWQAKNRTSTAGVEERFCPRHHGGQGAWLPVEHFEVKNPVTGTLRYCCADCWREYQRERYVAANKTAIIVEVRDGDEIVGAYCNGCGAPFEIGDLVTGVNLRHRDCTPNGDGHG